MEAKLLLLLTFLAIHTLLTSAANHHKIVSYWGQNAVYNSMKDRQYWEKDLAEFCRDYNYDVIALSFLNVFFEPTNKDRMPGFNFAFHCETPISPEYPKLFRCPKIEDGIKECQKNGKKVLMSLGGAVGKSGFSSQDDAKLFAYRVYHLLLEGEELQSLRPFGRAILDGVDLDIENGDYKYYDIFVKELRRLEKNNEIIIGAAPQCPYPDRLLGPSTGRVLGEVPSMVNEIYIQFYNNWCHTGNERVFWERVKQWLDYSKKENGPKIFVGVPGNIKASGNDKHYRPPKELEEIYKRLKDEPMFGGFMFWDASFDQNNIIDGKHFSEHIRAMYGDQDLPSTGNPKTLPPNPNTLVPTSNKKLDLTKSTKPPEGPTEAACKGLHGGHYKHPTDCEKFIQCSHGVAYVKICPPGLKFNPPIQVCDWPRNVNC